MTSARTALLALAVASAPLLWTAPASAQSSGILSTSWRQQDRGDVIGSTISSPQRFALELRGAPYWAQVDSEFGGASKPYEKAFGAGPRLYLGLEFDFLPFRIPYVGVIGPGLGWGYTVASAKATFAEGDNKGGESGEYTSLAIMPMYLAVVLRVDELMRRTRVPIVPYAKFGAGLALWKASNGTGRSEYADPMSNKTALGSGNSPGLHLALGGAVSLDFLDPRSSARLDESTGINHIYLFGEWMNAMLGSFGASRAMHVGTSTVVGGLAMDM
jgi:hypothetical protein